MKMTKLKRKTWKIRVLRYSPLMPVELSEVNPNSGRFKNILKDWIKENIPRDGDLVFKGKVLENKEVEIDTDWLTLELDEWQKKNEHDILCQYEWRELSYIYKD